MKVVVGRRFGFQNNISGNQMIARVALDVELRTTLLNYILDVNHGKKIAIIENEFGEACVFHTTC